MKPLKFAADRSIPERWQKWRYRHPRLATGALVGMAACLFLLLPASVYAIRQNQLAERRMQIETAEAKQLAHEMVREARSVQVLLATVNRDPVLLGDGLQRGRAVLDRLHIDGDPGWRQNPLFALLPSERQQELRYELTEMLLLMGRGEKWLTEDTKEAAFRQEGYLQALRWNILAEQCNAPDKPPRLLVRQREELMGLLPKDTGRGDISPIVGELASDRDGYHRGVAFLMAGQWRDAIPSLREFTECHPRHFHSQFVLGSCYFQLAQYPEASVCFNVCVSLEPEMPWTYFSRGAVRLQMLDQRGAEADFGKALELRPDWVEPQFNRAIARKADKNYRGALADLDRLLAKNGSTIRTLLLRSQVKELAGDLTGAASDKAEAMSRTPLDELSWSARGYLRMKEEPEAALKDFDEALKINHRSRDALVNKTIVLADLLGREREAIAVFDRIVELYPDWTRPRGVRSVLLARLGDCSKARRDADESLRRDHSPQQIFQMACVYAQIFRHEKTIETCQKSLGYLELAVWRGGVDLGKLQNEPDLEPIRGQAEFKQLLDAALKMNEAEKPERTTAKAP